MLTGKIFDIQRFSVHDGPGVRTTVFMKGCPLRCRWCHNPEGLKARSQLKYTDSKCIGCGRCASICRNHYCSDDGRHMIHFENCTLCGKCIAACPTGALEVCGSDMTADEVLSVIMKDKAFYRKNGGVTISGGECLTQADFVSVLLKMCRENGINTAVDTCGFVPFSEIEKTIPYTDTYLYDIKAYDSAIHKKYTGCANELIKENLIALSKYGVDIWIRIPVIPGVNDSDSEIDGISGFLGSLQNIKRITLLPYHAFGGGKYPALGMKYDFETNASVTEETLEKFKKSLERNKLTVK